MKRPFCLLIALFCTATFAQPGQEASQLKPYMSVQTGPATSYEMSLRFKLNAYSTVAAQDDGSIGVVLGLSTRTGVPYNDVAKFLLEDVPASFAQLKVDQEAPRAEYCRTPLETTPEEHATRMRAYRHGNAAAIVKWANDVKRIAPPALWEHFYELADGDSISTLTIDHEAKARESDWSVVEFRSKFCAGI